MTGRSSRLSGAQAPAGTQHASCDPDALLAEIARTQKLSRRLYGYAQAAPHLIIWGMIWLICNLGQYVRPDLSGLIWSGGLAVGIAGSFLIGMRQQGSRAETGRGWRWAGSVLAVLAGMTALIWILEPRGPEQVNAAWSLVVAVAYMLLGIWRGARFLILGIMVGAAVVASWSAFRESFSLIMAVAGGGALLLGGWWLLEEDRR